MLKRRPAEATLDAYAPRIRPSDLRRPSDRQRPAPEPKAQVPPQPLQMAPVR
jgi:hypothetical protein